MNLRFVAISVTIAAIGFAGGFASHAVKRRVDPIRFAIERRIGVIDERARRAPDGPVLVIGDSITERSELTRLCGRPVFNAGVSSAAAEDVAGHARSWISELRPVAVVIALGTNNAHADGTLSLENYEAAIRKIAGAGVPVGISGIPTLEAKPGAMGFSQEHIDALNGRLRAIAASMKAPFAAPIAPSTEDGVHPDDAGDQIWRANLEKACPAISAGSAQS